jgi:hypothetical protein
MKNFIIGLFASSNVKKFAKIIKGCPDHWEYSVVPQDEIAKASLEIEKSYVITHIAGLCGFSYFITKSGNRRVAFIGPSGNVIPVTGIMDSIYLCDALDYYLSMPDEDKEEVTMMPIATGEHASL